MPSVPVLGYRAAYLKQTLQNLLIDHTRYVREHGDDMPSVRDWVWSSGS